MRGILHRAVLVAFWVASAWFSDLKAGGSGLNTIVIINQLSSNSCELGNYYSEKRNIPPENVLRINWPGGNTSWTSNDFAAVLLSPLTNMLAQRNLAGQIQFVVLSMDIPFQTTFGATINSTTSALFYGLKTNGEGGLVNTYAASESAFDPSQVAHTPGYSFLATMITAQSLSQAKELVDHGVSSDSSFPTQTVVLAKTSDPDRNIRHPLFNNAIFNVRILGASSILRTNTDSVWWPDSCLGFQTGLATFSASSYTFVPGAIADSMTSFGGVIFGPNTQTNLLAFINAGAAGSYGTVAEPGTDTQKFPNPQVYFYQARGFSLAEAYYQSIPAPYLGLTVAEPLAAPFAKPGVGSWQSPESNTIVSGVVPLSLHFDAGDPRRPLQKADLFVDGKYFSTITNLTPQTGNNLSVSLNGYLTTYTVPSNATIATVVTGLTAALNVPAITNLTKARAYAFGDRIELRSMPPNPSAFPYYVDGIDSTNSPLTTYKVAYLPDSFPPGMNPCGLDSSGAFQMQLEIPTKSQYVVLASTNLIDWDPIATNCTPGQVDFLDQDAPNFSSRFYRLVGPEPDLPPRVSSPQLLGDGSLQIQVETQPGQPCAIQVSSNLLDWTSLATNQAGGAITFVDPPSADPWRLYRTWRVPAAAPSFTVLTQATEGVDLVRIDSAALPYQVEVSTNGESWTALYTNFALNSSQTEVASDIGSADVLSAFITASASQFMASEAYGYQNYSVITSTPPVGAWLAMIITKTNNQIVTVGATNTTGGIGSVELAQQLYNAIQTNSALQDSDGIVAEDFNVNLGGVAGFTVRTRNPGYPAALTRIQTARSTLPQTPYFLPSGLKALTNNLSDLQARNHFYITAGMPHLHLDCQLDTTALPDGYHELSAVAYEGSHVRTQTRTTLPIRIQNTSLSATLTLLDLTNMAPAQATYHIQVNANAPANTITLFTTGGPLATQTNVANSVFELHGTNLWAGLHPFYALVKSPDGHQYQTETHWIRLVNAQ